MAAGAVRAPDPGVTVKIRLSGTGGACAEAARRLHRLFCVTSVSQPYPGAGGSQLVAVYVRARLDLRPPPAAAAGEGTGPPGDAGTTTEVGPAPGGEP